MKDWTKDKLINEIGYNKTIKGLDAIVKAFNELDIDITNWRVGSKYKSVVVPDEIVIKMNELCRKSLNKNWECYKTAKWDIVMSETKEREYIKELNKIQREQQEREKRRQERIQEQLNKEENFYNQIPKDQQVNWDWIRNNIGVYNEEKPYFLYYWFLLQGKWKRANWKGDIEIEYNTYKSIQEMCCGPLFLKAKFQYKGYTHEIIGTYKTAEDNDSGIYGIYINDKLVYIGMTCRNFEERWNEHRKCFEARSGSNYYLYTALNPGDVLRFEKLIKVEDLKVNSAITRRDLEAMELALIRLYQPKYNYQGVSDNEYKFTLV